MLRKRNAHGDRNGERRAWRLNGSRGANATPYRRPVYSPGYARVAYARLAVRPPPYVPTAVDRTRPRDEMQRVGRLLIRHPGVCLSWHTCRAQGNGRSPQVDEAARSRAGPPREALTRINLLHDISHDGTGLPVGSRCENALPC